MFSFLLTCFGIAHARLTAHKINKDKFIEAQITLVDDKGNSPAAIINEVIPSGASGCGCGGGGGGGTCGG